jgi:hypothetical protein
MSVSFDKYFGKEYAKVAGKRFNLFNLTKKKTYKNISQKIVDAVKFVGDRSERFVYNYHKIKCVILGAWDLDAFISDDDDYVGERAITLPQFYKAIDKLFDEEVVAIISDHIDEIYEEQQQDETKVKNIELQFKTVHTKAVCKASFCMKLAIPLLLDFCDLQYKLIKEANPKAESPINSFIFDCFIDILQKFSPKGIDLENKIFKLTESRVVATQYSDKIMWSCLRNSGVTAITTTRLQYKKLVYDILPKLEHNREIVSFLHTTLKNQIKFMFEQKFTFRFNPINTIDVDSDDGTNPFERIEQAYQHDEGLGLINKINVDSIIKKYQRELEYTPSKEEVQYYIENIKVNEMQRRIVSLIFQRDMGKKEVINYASRSQYVRLLLLAEQALIQQELVVMSEIIMGIAHETDIIHKDTLTSKKFMIELLKSTSYKKLNAKFDSISQRLSDSKLIISFIATLDKNKFSRIKKYGSTNDSTPINYPLNVIADEVLRFIQLIC